MKRSGQILIILGLCLLASACLTEEEQEQEKEEEQARYLAILTNTLDAEQAGGTAQVAFRNEYDPGTCSAWYVNINKDSSTKSVISSTDTNNTSGTVSVPAPDVYDLDIRCSNESTNVNYASQTVENGRSYLLHYKSDSSISFAESSL